MLVVSTDIKQEKIEVRHVKHVLTFLPENKLLKNRKIKTNFDDFSPIFRTGGIYVEKSAKNNILSGIIQKDIHIFFYKQPKF